MSNLPTLPPSLTLKSPGSPPTHPPPAPAAQASPPGGPHPGPPATWPLHMLLSVVGTPPPPSSSLHPPAPLPRLPHPFRCGGGCCVQLAPGPSPPQCPDLLSGVRIHPWGLQGPGFWGRGGRSAPSRLRRGRSALDHVARPEGSQEFGGRQEATRAACGHCLSHRVTRPQEPHDPQPQGPAPGTAQARGERKGPHWPCWRARPRHQERQRLRCSHTWV